MSSLSQGIRSNNHMANIHMTRACQNTLSPLWEESFDYMVPADWGLVELVGLKAMIYDQDEDTQTYQGQTNDCESTKKRNHNGNK